MARRSTLASLSWKTKSFAEGANGGCDDLRDLISSFTSSQLKPVPGAIELGDKVDDVD